MLPLWLGGIVVAAGQNPFASHAYYVNARYQARVRESIKQAWVDESTRLSLQSMLTTGSAFWIDTISRIKDADRSVTLESVFRDAASLPTPPLVVVILYNLPNRDCHASASNGELCCQYNPDGTCVFEATDPTCADGLARYRRHYVDPFAATLEQYRTVPVAVVIEPDSLPNLATNLADSRCGNAATQAAYVQGVGYAIRTLFERAPHAALYLDAGHGGWLGWPDKADDFLQVVGRLGNAVSHLRGFATNTANYQSLGAPCPLSAFEQEWPQLGQQYCAENAGAECCRDPCGLLHNFNSANNEHNYCQLLAARARRSSISALLPSPRFLIDTGRNGRDDMRQDCANWCNVRGAAVGHVPTAQTALPSLIDAYFWLKTPGESDGCTEILPNGERCARYDGACGSVDSIGSRQGEPRAPEAGQFFASQFAELSCRAGGGVQGSASQDCQKVVDEAAAEADAEATKAPLEVEGPRYDWRQPTGSDGAARLTTGGGTQESTDKEASEASAGLWLTLMVLMFATWFFYPLIEARLRRAVGAERYDASWAFVTALTARAGAGLGLVATSILRARRNLAGCGQLQSSRSGTTSTKARSRRDGKPKRLPTVEERDVETECDVIE